jgi:redox-sensing transcriptional repressor
MAGYVSDAVIRRLPAYNRHLRELEEEGILQISSQELGDRMGLTPSQIRQDINSFGGFGRQGYGYQVKELRQHIRHIMGLDQEHRMVIIGAGRMGQAIANYTGFPRQGFFTEALFDIDPAKIRMGTAEMPVYHADELEERLKELHAVIGVLALPPEAAQDTLDRLYRSGIRAIWNFSPVDLHYPPDMAVVNVHLSDLLQILSYQMKRQQEE